jgi:hypothetical protein
MAAAPIQIVSNGDPIARLYPDDLVSPEFAARILSVSPETLKNYRYRGIGPKAQKSGRRSVRYKVRDLLAYLDR